MTSPAGGSLSTPVLVGLAGRHILRSRSPWLHEQEASAQGLALRYELFDFADRQWNDDRLPTLLKEAEHRGLAGLNITYPFKQRVMPLLHDWSPGARLVGAVNTVAFVDGKRIGYNTDVTGFAESFLAELPQAPLERVVMIGAGGAGAAVAQALLTLGVKHIEIFDASSERQAALVEHLSAQASTERVAAGRNLAAAMGMADGLVNATPVGMTKNPGLPIDTALLKPSHWVADVVYVPLETQLLAAARERGCRILSGGGMAICQAAAAFEIFTGLAADRGRMRASFAKFPSL